MKDYNKEQIQSYLKDIIYIVAYKFIENICINVSFDVVQLTISDHTEYKSYLSECYYNSKYDISYCGFTDKVMPIWEMLDEVKKL